MAEQSSRKSRSRGAASFCIPKAALKALIEARASAYEVCTYLVLSRFTDESGQYSTASISAVNRYTGANKTKGGPADRAISRLKNIHAKTTTKIPNGRAGKHHAMVEKTIDLGPILFDRDTWCAQTGEILPDGLHERAKILHILPSFSEPASDRVWFGAGLVDGFGAFKMPLKGVKNAGDVAARLLLLLYQANDMETWGGVRPIGECSGPWNHYERVADDVHLGAIRLIRAKDRGHVGPGSMFSQAWPAASTNDWWDAHNSAGGPVWQALAALESSGLVYQTVQVLNRNAIMSKFSNGDEYVSTPTEF